MASLTCQAQWQRQIESQALLRSSFSYSHRASPSGLSSKVDFYELFYIAPQVPKNMASNKTGSEAANLLKSFKARSYT